MLFYLNVFLTQSANFYFFLVADNKGKKLNEVEQEAAKAAAELEKMQAKDIKKEHKDRAKLEKQEAKTMKIAQELADKQAVARAEEERKAQELVAREAQAQQLANELGWFFIFK